MRHLPTPSWWRRLALTAAALAPLAAAAAEGAGASIGDGAITEGRQHQGQWRPEGTTLKARRSWSGLARALDGGGDVSNASNESNATDGSVGEDAEQPGNVSGDGVGAVNASNGSNATDEGLVSEEAVGADDDEPDICEVGGGGNGVFLPIFGDDEARWPLELRWVLYITGTLWCCLGVIQGVDFFLQAVEKIQSKKVHVYDKMSGKSMTKRAWSPMIAGMVLSDLGSKSPEIILGIIEVIGNGFKVGPLGPGTIVGGSSFNMFFVTGICIMSVPNGELRKVKDLGNLAVIVFCLIFIYAWLLLILEVISPNVVEIWEGLSLLLAYPAVVFLASLADTGKLPFTKKPDKGVSPASTMEDLAAMELDIRQKYGQTVNLTADQVRVLMQYEFSAPESRAKHRINATRSMLAGKRVLGEESAWEKGAKLSRQLTSAEDLSVVKTIPDLPEVGFKNLNYSVLESVGTVDISVSCLGSLTDTIELRYTTRDGTAKSGCDYMAVSGVLTFGPNNTESCFQVRVIPSEGHEATKEFYVDLQECSKSLEGQGRYLLGSYKTATVCVIDEDVPGCLAFEQEVLKVERSTEEMVISVNVVRKRGSSGEVKCKYRTESNSAVAGLDFLDQEGELQFKHGELRQRIDVNILPGGRYEGDESFRIMLTEATGGATFDFTTDGGEESCIMTVNLHGNKNDVSKVAAVLQAMQINWDQVALGNANYKDQFISSFYCRGSAEGQLEATILDWAVHIIMLPWKLIYALVPPVTYANGWLTMITSLFLLTANIAALGDFANLLGCVLGLSSMTTAVTVLAVGLSLPDYVTARTACKQEPYADGILFGMVSASCVATLLGIGLPWTIGSIYWKIVGATPKWLAENPTLAEDYPDGAFVVEATGIVPIVSWFLVFDVLTDGLLLLRRRFFGGELGGPAWSTRLFAVILAFLWVVFLVIYFVTVGR